MHQYTFRVLLDFKEDVFRDIEIKSDQNFFDLHIAIQKAFGFDETQMSSFYLSDEEWNKGEEISMMDMAEEAGASQTISMQNTEIGKLTNEIGEKLIYVTDFFLMWCFYVDLVKIDNIDFVKQYPNTSYSFGNAPDQYSKDPDFQMQGSSVNDFDDESEEDDIFEDFDDLEQYY